MYITHAVRARGNSGEGIGQLKEEHVNISRRPMRSMKLHQTKMKQCDKRGWGAPLVLDGLILQFHPVSNLERI